jgi:fatty acid desaturase (delta-4 desaturase)
MNIQHDANHGAISRNSIINRVLGYSQNWIGGSALDWIHQHVVQHHITPNHVHADPDIVGNDLLRLNPLKPLMNAHAAQYIYIFVLLAVFGMSHIFYSLKHNLDGFQHTRMSKLVMDQRLFEELTILFFALRWIVLPLIQLPALSTLLNVVPMFVVGGYYLAFFFVISHNFDGAVLYDNEKNHDVNESFLRKQVATASNVGGSFLCFMNGGLNYQIEHHLFPRIQHTHYPLIAPVVRAYCEKKKIPYVHFPTVLENVQSCMRHLYQLGTQTNPSGYKQ